MVMMVIAESVIIAGCLTLKKIIERIPPHLSSINVMTIFIPLLLNIIVMAVCTDNLYNDKKVIIGNIWSVITISIVPIVMFLGTVCNIVILENYLNVKKIENEKKLQISEMSLQYDYYMKQSKDMENIRRLSHDIKNHLEALKENIEPEQKISIKVTINQGILLLIICFIRNDWRLSKRELNLRCLPILQSFDR